jgi:hypothetical protein
VRVKSHRFLRPMIVSLVVIALGLPTLLIGYMAVSGSLWLLPALGRVASPSGIAPDLGLLMLCMLAMFGSAVYWSASFRVVMRHPPHRLPTLAVAIVGLVAGPAAWLVPQLKAGPGLSPLVFVPALGLLGITYWSHWHGSASNRAA